MNVIDALIRFYGNETVDKFLAENPTITGALYGTIITKTDHETGEIRHIPAEDFFITPPAVE